MSDPQSTTETAKADKVYVGAQLRAARLAAKLSLDDVTVQSGGTLVASAVGSYERGERSVSTHKLMALARLYKVRAADLLPPATELYRIADELEAARRAIAAVAEDMVPLVGVPANAHALAIHAARYLERAVALVTVARRGDDATATIDLATDEAQ